MCNSSPRRDEVEWRRKKDFCCAEKEIFLGKKYKESRYKINCRPLLLWVNYSRNFPFIKKNTHSSERDTFFWSFKSKYIKKYHQRENFFARNARKKFERKEKLRKIFKKGNFSSHFTDFSHIPFKMRFKL